MDPIYTFIVRFILTIRINSHKLDPIDKEMRICSLKMLGTVAARPEEVIEKPLGRQICGEKMVFYRGKENRGLCSRRLLPTSRCSTLFTALSEDGDLSLWLSRLKLWAVMARQLLCLDSVFVVFHVTEFRVVEKFGLSGVWPGDQSLASEDQLPELEWADNPEWAYGGGLFHINCDYRLMIDNLIDLLMKLMFTQPVLDKKKLMKQHLLLV